MTHQAKVHMIDNEREKNAIANSNVYFKFIESERKTMTIVSKNEFILNYI